MLSSLSFSLSSDPSTLRDRYFNDYTTYWLLVTSSFMKAIHPVLTLLISCMVHPPLHPMLIRTGYAMEEQKIPKCQWLRTTKFHVLVQGSKLSRSPPSSNCAPEHRASLVTVTGVGSVFHGLILNVKRVIPAHISLAG